MGIAKGWIVYLKVSSIGKKQRNLNYFCRVSAMSIAILQIWGPLSAGIKPEHEPRLLTRRTGVRISV